MKRPIANARVNTLPKSTRKVIRRTSTLFVVHVLCHILADAQKQERIEQMMADMNKYKKADKELTVLRQKHLELEQVYETTVNDLTVERDQLQVQCDQLKVKMLDYEQSADPNTDDLRQQLNGFKAKNDQLRQRNWKIMEELNRLLREQEQQQSGQPS